MVAAPAIMVAPFVLGFSTAATVVAVAVGAVLLGLSLQLETPSRTIPLTAHAGFDYTIAAIAAAGGLTVGLATGEWVATAFLAGVGAAQVLLTASTRFSMARSA
jgi:hypothetical protein